jgi:hypothetical protein
MSLPSQSVLKSEQDLFYAILLKGRRHSQGTGFQEKIIDRVKFLLDDSFASSHKLVACVISSLLFGDLK